MKALMKKEVGKGWDGLELVDIPKPVPKKNELLIKIMATGICGTDLHIMMDEYPHSVPVVLGHEFTGIVEEVGEETSGFKPGDHVIVNNITGCGHCHYCKKGDYVFCAEKKSIGINLNGGMAEYTVVPFDHAMLVPPAMQGKDTPALSEPIACCVRAVLEKTKIQPGDKVLITGPGFMGLMCAQLAKLCGAYVIISGTPADKERMEMALRQGADRVADNFEDLKKIVEEVTDGGVDVVLECSGSPYAIPGALELVRKQGAWTQVGMFGKDVTLALDTLVRKEVDFNGTFATANSTWEKLVKLYEGGALQLDEFVSARIPLENWKEGFEMFLRKEGIKLFLVP